MLMIEVARVGDIPEGGGIVVEAEGRQIALFKVEGKVYAIDNTCPHKGGPLGEGECEGFVVTCPLHGWKFDVRTGEFVLSPNISVPTYKVEIVGDKVMLEE